MTSKTIFHILKSTHCYTRAPHIRGTYLAALEASLAVKLNREHGSKYGLGAHSIGYIITYICT